MPRTSLATLILLLPLACLAAALTPRTVAVLHGTEGRTEADSRYNQTLSRYLARWIDECGVAVCEAPDTQAAAALASPCAVAWILGVNAPSKGTLSAVDAFLARGGKIIAVNCLSADINARVGAEPKGFRPSPGLATWTGLRFEGKRPLFAPETLPMTISAITECVPRKGKGAAVRAHWTTPDGSATPYAAVLSASKGFCLTAPLSGSALPSARRRFLLSLMGDCAPAIWRESATTLRKRLGAEKFLRRPPSPDSSRRAAFDSALAESRTLLAAADKAHADGLLATETQKLLALQAKMDFLRACAQKPWKGSVHAVWDQIGYGFSPGHWDDTCARLQKVGVTDLFLLVATPTWTHATVPGLAPSPLRKAHGDQLAAAVVAAHRHGLRIHAWISAYGLMNPTAKEIADLHAAGRLLVGPDGKPIPTLNPRLSANSARILDTALHLARTYAIDGIHLDYIRYGTTFEKPTAAERSRFETAMKKTAKAWPADVLEKGPLHKDYMAYRRYAIGGTIKTLRTRLKADFPKLLLTAAVYGHAERARENVGQDWLSWLANDYIDWAIPMNYASGDGFEKILDAQKCKSNIRGRIVSGVGVTAAECDLSPAEVLRQIDVLRRRGYKGYALFDLDPKLQDEILPVLAP